MRARTHTRARAHTHAHAHTQVQCGELSWGALGVQLDRLKACVNLVLLIMLCNGYGPGEMY